VDNHVLDGVKILHGNWQFWGLLSALKGSLCCGVHSKKGLNPQ